ncbi:HAMP domain-containing sensor histidine kinase [Sulfurimonas sp. C5]|uniref:sensor histidine kinase n=1 Tax=Sulfurimonas sp. C5 TaxID=3036947 RepID=UPI0024570587|nr:HAMP domain-containing sensor histidine kinase [Sulfurimonas sp. C5]MDH4944498.1 HAMP domain-containing sensor histidine kinase [Sulfurimonas sp. C5]
MKNNPFSKANDIVIKRRKNPKGEYAHLNTTELLDAVKKSAHSTHRADLDILLEIFLDRYNARQDELDQLNKELEQRIKTEVQKSKTYHKRYEQQAKMAAMGEMMDAVAHQWKQPLNALSMMGDLLVSDYESGDLTLESLKEMREDMQAQIDHMVTTLSEFRNFFRPKEKNETFGIKRSSQSVTLLVKDEFLKNNINIKILPDYELLIYGNENEFKHLVLNIINNAKDAFNERNVENREITIDFMKDDKCTYLEIKDNAGGIPEKIIRDIFKPEVTTKPEGKGTGIGLYMSTQIAQKLGGVLSVRNGDNGAIFQLKIPLPL